LIKIFKKLFCGSLHRRNPSDLAAEILNDLRRILDKQFPSTSPPITAVDREVDAQQAIVAHLATGARLYNTQRSQVHAYINSLASHPLMVTGEEGSGKTLFLASIAAEYKKYNPDALVTFNTIGVNNKHGDIVMQSIIDQIR